MAQRRLNPTIVVLLAVFAATCATASLAEARPAGRAKVQAQTSLSHLDTASTDCFAEAVLANPAALAHAKASRWYQAAGVIGVVCRREVDRMMQARDAIQGPGASQQYFRTVYAKRLDRELAARLRPWLERQSVASAEPRNEQSVKAAHE